MNKYLYQLAFVLWSINSWATTPLPSTYTLTETDYASVGNGTYHNFDVRSGGEENDPLVILNKINTILYANFTATEDDKITVYFEIYDGKRKQTSWDLFVENSKFRTDEYILDDSGGPTQNGYENLGSASTLDICTWNIEHFPKNSSTLSKVKDIIIKSQIDVFGLQEIADDRDDFADLLSSLGSDYGGYIYNPDYDSDPTFDQNIAFVYKKDEITLVTTARNITELSDSYYFPRMPIEIVLKHSSGVEFVVINNHLKCCSGSEGRRRGASERLKEYIDDKYKPLNTKVVMLGDLNDRIDSGENDNVFKNFINDADNYIFVDEKVSEASQYTGGWTNIDHILINKELFEFFDKDADKLDDDDFDYNYDTYVSDHFPVWVNLNTDLLSNDVNYVYKAGLEIYPNPSSNSFITIKFAEKINNANISVVNIQGQLLIQKNIDSKSFDVSNLPKGIYIINLNQDGILYTGKFVKK